MYTVEVEGLSKSYGDQVALDGIDLRVADGTVVALLGANGAGKTTLVRVLSTLLPFDAGRAVIAGHDLRADPAGVRQSISLTGQFAALDDALTGREHLAMVARLRRVPTRDMARACADQLESFGLTSIADRRVATYSGGEQRRLDLALSTLGRPRLLFLDEPTTGLDPRSREQLWHVVRGLTAEGVTVVLTTQYLDEADQLAGRIAVIDRGRKVAEGTPDELKTSVGSSTLQLRMAEPSETGDAVAVVRRVLGEEPVLTPEAGGMNAALTDANRAADVLIALRQSGLSIASATVQKPTLDEVFMAITGHGAEDENHEHPTPEMEAVR